MKNSMMILGLLILTSSVFADTSNALSRPNRFFRFLAESKRFKDFSISSVIGARCATYLAADKSRGCKDAVQKLIQNLDYDVIFSDDIKPPLPKAPWTPSSFVFVAFKQNLINLLSQPKTTRYLNDLNEQLYLYLVGEKSKLKVWDLTKKHFSSDYLTSMVMATLFQDTSMMKLHLAYLERTATTGKMNFESNKEMLSRVIDTINLILDASEEYYSELFFPDEIYKDLNRNIYHFYVPLYLSKVIHLDGASKEDAYHASLMLNLAYEFLTQSNDYRYLFMDPQIISSTHTIKDIYAGHCGASMGVLGMNFSKNFESLRATFERSVPDAVEMLIWR
jgi:hypothetical protein